MHKSLCLIPERFAIEMIDRGWTLRNQIIWHKPNCMPSSAKDRFTMDFEYVFFFVKNKKYWFETQYEKYTEPMNRWGGKYKRRAINEKLDPKGLANANSLARPQRDMRPNKKGRNKRCVWEITTKPYPEAHFAVYPEKLVERMIKSGCPEKGIVLDPFHGSGTTGIVAKKLNRNFIGYELNPDYIKLSEKRYHDELGMFG